MGMLLPWWCACFPTSPGRDRSVWPLINEFVLWSLINEFVLWSLIIHAYLYRLYRFVGYLWNVINSQVPSHTHPPSDFLIIHIHGGGFVAQSSASHSVSCTSRRSLIAMLVDFNCNVMLEFIISVDGLSNRIAMSGMSVSLMLVRPPWPVRLQSMISEYSKYYS